MLGRTTFAPFGDLGGAGTSARHHEEYHGLRCYEMADQFAPFVAFSFWLVALRFTAAAFVRSEVR